MVEIVDFTGHQHVEQAIQIDVNKVAFNGQLSSGCY